MPHESCDVAVVGAGPYGLAAGSHLKAEKVATRVFGSAMSFWRGNMPKGMKLRSPWRASHIADPFDEHTLDIYAAEHKVPRTENLPLADFVRYGEWFQRRAVPDLDTRMVRSLAPSGKGFRLTLEDGDTVDARRVVIATGLTNQGFRPAPFEGLPTSLVSHASEVANPQDFRGRRVAVIGRGQSACESAVLLHEAGAEVDLICRGDIHWIGSETPGASRSGDLLWWARAILAGPSAVGPFPFNWLVDAPGLLRRLPAEWRGWVSMRSLRPAATAWLRPRAAGIHIRAGRSVVGASAQGDQLAVTLDDGQSAYDHVVLGTGYRVDLAKLGIIAPDLLRKVRLNSGFPVLSAGFETSVPGLHVVGSPAVGTFGPLPRFVAGAGYAARCVTRAALKDAPASITSRIPRHAIQPQA